jgi:hypothetical protein
MELAQHVYMVLNISTIHAPFALTDIMKKIINAIFARLIA